MTSDDDFARFLATRSPGVLERERFGTPEASERTGSASDVRMRAEHRARAESFWAWRRARLGDIDACVREADVWVPKPDYVPRRGLTRDQQLAIAVRAAERTAA